MSGRLRTVFRALFTIWARQGCGPPLPPPPPSRSHARTTSLDETASAIQDLSDSKATQVSQADI